MECAAGARACQNTVVYRIFSCNHINVTVSNSSHLLPAWVLGSLDIMWYIFLHFFSSF